MIVRLVVAFYNRMIRLGFIIQFLFSRLSINLFAHNCKEILVLSRIA